MRFSALLVKFSLGIAFLVVCSSALFAQDAELVRHFDYDARSHCVPDGAVEIETVAGKSYRRDSRSVSTTKA